MTHEYSSKKKKTRWLKLRLKGILSRNLTWRKSRIFSSYKQIKLLNKNKIKKSKLLLVNS